MWKKNIKKGFFVNNKKYLFFLVFMGIFCTFSNYIEAISSSTQSTSQESTISKNTRLQKKEKSQKIAAARRERLQLKRQEIQAKKNLKNSKYIQDGKIEKVKPITPLSDSICPYAGVPIEHLSSIELEEVLTCAQAQKEKLDTQVEKLEELIVKVEEEEKLDPAKKRKPLFFNAPRCPYSSTPLKKLKAEQLEEVYAYTQKHKMDSAFMIDLLERLIALSDNHAGVKQYKLQLADTHYAVHHIEKAAACYEDFGVLYPGSKENEYVLYKAVVCMFELSLEPDRDQTNSKKTIALVKEFLKHAKNPDLVKEAHDILNNCYNRLYEHEVYVLNFYAKKKNFVAAQMRLDFIAKTFTDTIPNLDAKVAHLTAELELKKNPIKPTKKAIINKLLA